MIGSWNDGGDGCVACWVLDTLCYISNVMKFGYIYIYIYIYQHVYHHNITNYIINPNMIIPISMCQKPNPPSVTLHAFIDTNVEPDVLERDTERQHNLVQYFQTYPQCIHPGRLTSFIIIHECGGDEEGLRTQCNLQFLEIRIMCFENFAFDRYKCQICPITSLGPVGRRFK